MFPLSFEGTAMWLAGKLLFKRRHTLMGGKLGEAWETDPSTIRIYQG